MAYEDLDQNTRRTNSLVTGAGEGIGQAIALALAEQGAQVIATDLALPAETVSKIGPTACAFQLDVALEEDWRSVAAKSRDVCEVDIVVNNAGYFPNRSIDELDLATPKDNGYEFRLVLFEREIFLAKHEEKEVGPFPQNFVEYGRPGDTRHEPLHHHENRDYRVHAGLSPQATGRARRYYRRHFILTSDDAAFITGQPIVVDGVSIASANAKCESKQPHGSWQQNTAMKFIEASKFGGPEVLTVVEAPTPSPNEGMLLVEIRAAGVNYADIMARSGFYPQVPKAPFPVGFEIAGLVKGVGKGVEGFKEGDSVAAITQGGGYATHAVILYLDSIGDLRTEAFPLLSQSGQWIIFGVRSRGCNALPFEAVPLMIEKNITLRGFNLGGSLQQVPQALSALFKLVGEGKLKLEITRYPHTDVDKVHQLFEAHKISGKLVLVPQN